MRQGIFWALRFGLAGTIMVFVAACATTPANQQTTRASILQTLRVGVVADYQPLVWKRDNQIVGLEADFAQQLAIDLHMQLQLKEYAWDEIFQALDAGKIDIVMAGVSITEERAQKYLFATPYMVIGQMAIIRTNNVAELNTPGALHSGRYRIGYVAGTTGEDYVRDKLSGKLYAFNHNEEGVRALAANEIDFFIHDAPTVWQLANYHEFASNNQLLGLYKPLTKEYLAWVMAKDNQTLRAKVDMVHQRWLTSGFIAQKIKQWIPVVIVTDGG